MRDIAATITKDTRLCISLAARPSNIGTRFHNYLYEQLGLDFVYKAFAPRDIAGAVAGIRGLGIRGAAVSMPYKEAVIPLVDELTASAEAVQSVNTIVNDDGLLRAYNTDVLAVERLVRAKAADLAADPDADVAVVGSGGMAKACVAAVRAVGFGRGLVVARNAATGAPLAERYGLTYAAGFGAHRPRLVLNATPIGMAGGAEERDLSIPRDVVEAADVVVDVVAVPRDTPLIRAARAAGKRVVTGAEIVALQAAEQFTLYTGITLTPEQIAAAAAFSRSGAASV